MFGLLPLLPSRTSLIVALGAVAATIAVGTNGNNSLTRNDCPRVSAAASGKRLPRPGWAPAGAENPFGAPDSDSPEGPQA